MEPKESLLALRKRHGLTQEEMARKLLVTRQAVSRWENGITVPNSDTLKIISALFKVSINAILGQEQNFGKKFPPALEHRKGDYMLSFENIHKEHFPPLRFTGKRYTNKDRVDGGYGAHWREWFEKGWFDALVVLPPLPEEVQTGYIGFMRWKCDFENTFEYWIGTFDLPDTPPPPGYASLDIPESDIGVVWIHGRESDGIYSQHGKCESLLEESGMTVARNIGGDGYTYCFERYHGGRFDTPDSEGRVILDYGIFVE